MSSAATCVNCVGGVAPLEKDQPEVTSDHDSSSSLSKLKENSKCDFKKSARNSLSSSFKKYRRKSASSPCSPVDDCRSFTLDQSNNGSSESLSNKNKLDTSSTRKIKKMDRDKYNFQLDQIKDDELSTCLSQSRIDKFHKLFHSVPEDEKPIDFFSCAFVGDILLQGNLYISLNWICFYSNIRARLRKIEIKMETIIDITPEKTALIIPNAIGILTADKRYVFGSFMSRDHTYKFIRYIWKSFIESHRHADADITNIPIGLNENREAGDDKVSLSDNNASLLHDASSIAEPLDQTDTTTHEQSDDVQGDSIESDTTTSDRSCDNDAATAAVQIVLPDTAPPSHRKVRLRTRHPKERHTHGFLVYYLFHNLDPRKIYKTLSRFVYNIQRIPRINFLLMICTVMVMVLLASACLLMYKIMTLQNQIQTKSLWTSTMKQDFSDLTRDGVYNLHSKLHSATLEQLQTFLEANVQLLAQMSRSLKVLGSNHEASHDSTVTTEKTQDSLNSCDNTMNTCR